MYILGISCFYHEASATLIQNGKIVAASAEERFTRIKHDSDFPVEAIKFCLDTAKIKIKDVDFVVFYEKPYWKFQRVLLSTLATFPNSPMLFAKGMVNFLTDKLWVRSLIREKLKIPVEKILFVPHHLSHASSAFYVSPFSKAAILTVDGVGEWITTMFSYGEDRKIKVLEEIKFPHSLGILYSVFTAFLGYEVNDGEYKVMGMAAYGKPKYLKKVEKLVRRFTDGSFALNMEYFSFHRSLTASYNKRFEMLFGKPRTGDLVNLSKTNQRYLDIAASIQKFTEDQLLILANSLYEKTKSPNLCIAGGVGLNSVANGVLLARGPFKNIFIQPAAGDNGGSLGAALFVYHSILGKKRNFIQEHSYFGKSYDNKQIEKFLKKNKIKYTKISNEEKLVEKIADELTSEKVVGFFAGRAEWGPRALGARSILASPRKVKMKDILNSKIKFREAYRPFAPVVLEEKVNEYFVVKGLNHKNLTKFMLGVFKVRRDARKKIPAAVHADGTGRVQIINKKQNSRYYNVIKRFGKKTGIYALINTSFNLKGEPIVNSPDDAFATFRASGLDVLILENFLIFKEDIM